MEIDKVLLDDDIELGVKVIASWVFGGQNYISTSISFFEIDGSVKIKLDHENGVFIFDKNSKLIDPNFEIKFYFENE